MVPAGLDLTFWWRDAGQGGGGTPRREGGGPHSGSIHQIRFVEMVIDQLTAPGIMEASALYEPPFSDLHAEGPDTLFGGKEKVIEGIFEELKDATSGLAEEG